MLTRRDFLQVAAATAALAGMPGLVQAAARQALTQAQLLAFAPVGRLTLLHFTDIHAQLMPLYFREPSVNLGVGEAKGLPPHITGRDFLALYGLPAASPEAYALTAADFTALARDYGRIGGLDRMATLVKAIRAERGADNVLLVDSGDTWQGSYTSLRTQGEDMVRAMNLLGVEAMTGHWEFTYGEDRVKELIDKLDFPFLAGNVVDNEWQEAAFENTAFFDKAGVRVAVIGQAFPYTPVANPRWMVPNWSFGIREEDVQKYVDAARAAGAQLVVLAGHTHDALPRVVEVGSTLLVASGSHGKFLSRLDLDVKDGKVAGYGFRLIPIFSDVIAPDPEMAALIADIRQPHQAELTRVLGRTESLLYRRGNFNGTFDDLICQALLSERDAQIALSPGFRWGASLLPGQEITLEDVHNQTSITYPAAYRSEMTGALIKDILEDVADNLFNPDPYYQQGGDMVRVGGMSYTIAPHGEPGRRISELRLTDGTPIAADKTYTVAGWASVNEGTQGPPIWDIVAAHIERNKVLDVPERNVVKVVGA